MQYNSEITLDIHVPLLLRNKHGKVGLTVSTMTEKKAEVQRA